MMMKFVSILAMASSFGRPVMSRVISLDLGSFDHILAQTNGTTLVNFCVPWSGRCSKLDDEYKQAAQELDRYNYTLFRVNCHEEKELCSRFDFEGYPTMVVFRDGKEHREFRGLTKDVIVEHVVRMNEPAVRVIDTVGEYESLKNSTELVFVGMFATSQERDVFREVAEDNREKGRFALVSQRIIDTLGLETPRLVAFKSFDELVSTFSGEFTASNLQTWVATERLPLVGPVDENTFSYYLETKLPLGFVFYIKDEDKTNLEQELYSVALRFKRQIVLGLIDAFEYGSLAKKLGLSEEIFPALSVHNFANDFKYPMDQNLVVNSTLVDGFLDGIVSGQVRPRFMSEPVPETNSGPVKVVVHDSFDSVVLDPTKDVLVKYHAPWCFACKGFAPVYELVAELYSAENDTILFSKMDLDRNDQSVSARLDLTRIPALYLFPAGQNKTPVAFTGNFSVQSIVQFIEHNSSFKHVPADSSWKKEDAAMEHQDL